MKNLLDRFVNLERVISDNKGDFSLFALFLREDSVDKWDLIVAAPWIDADRKEALKYITSQVQGTFSSDEISRLSRIVLVDPANPSVAAISKAISKALSIQHGQAEIRDSTFFGLQIKHGYIITSQRVIDDAQVSA